MNIILFLRINHSFEYYMYFRLRKKLRKKFPSILGRIRIRSLIRIHYFTYPDQTEMDPQQ